jgi:hypothetical protein
MGDKFESREAHSTRYRAARESGLAERGYRLAPKDLRMPGETIEVGKVGDNPLSRSVSAARVRDPGGRTDAWSATPELASSRQRRSIRERTTARCWE